MTPECEQMIVAAIVAASGHSRRWLAAMEHRHMLSLSLALDVAYGYAPGEGGWWLDRSIAATPLRIFVHDPLGAQGFTMYGALPLVTVHRQVTVGRTEVRGLYLEVAREERKDKLVEAFSENARALPRRLLLGEWERLGRAAPTPRVRRSPGPRLPLGGAS